MIDDRDQPWPEANTISGASAMIGMVWLATT